MIRSKPSLPIFVAVWLLAFLCRPESIVSFTSISSVVSSSRSKKTSKSHQQSNAKAVSKVLNLYFDSYNGNNQIVVEGEGGTEQDTNNEQQDFFFIRACHPADVGRAAEVLTEGFFKHKTNFITYQFERLGTYLSLEAGLPKPNTMHEIFVACDSTSGKVLGLAEVDARKNGNGARGQEGPYMCNVAVDSTYKRKGIATALIRKCEEQVQIWSSVNINEMYLSRSLYLKVRNTNQAAVAMYDKLGYSSVMYETEQKSGELILLMRKTLPDISKPSEGKLDYSTNAVVGTSSEVMI